MQIGIPCARSLRVTGVAAAFLCSFAWSAVWAQVEQGAPLLLQDAVSRALAANPGLVAARYEIDAEQARRDADSLSRPLRFIAQAEDFGGSGIASSFDAAQFTLQLGKVFELGDKPRWRGELGDARVRMAELERDIAQLDVAAETARRFVDVAIGQEAIVLAEQAIELAVGTNDLARRRVEVGAASDAERITTGIVLAQSRFERDRLGSELESARVALATLWAQETPNFLTVAAELYRLPVAGSFGEWKGQLDSNPDLNRIFDETRVREARLRVADSQRRSNLAVTGGVRYLGLTDDYAFVFQFSVPFGSGSRAQPGIAEAQARVDQAPLAAEEKRLELTGTLFALSQQLSTAREQHALLSDELIPQARTAAELYRKGYAQGSHTLLELNEAQKQLLALQVEALAAAGTFHQTLIEIDYLLGQAGPSGGSR